MLRGLANRPGVALWAVWMLGPLILLWGLREHWTPRQKKWVRREAENRRDAASGAPDGDLKVRWAGQMPSWSSDSVTREADTIDQLIESLTDIVDRSRAAPSRLGYFAALYRKVTLEVKQGIERGFFDDAERMERLNVVFANRHLTAFAAHRQQQPTTRAWDVSFDVARQRWPIVLQHLLLGMNAHINLDLGIAAARTVPAAALPALRDDFMRINEILARLVGGVESELAHVWPTLRLLNRYLGDVETALINFSMTKARDHAWSVAERLAPLGEGEQREAIDELDRKVAVLARVIRHPGVVAGIATKLIRLGERGSIVRKIDILM